MSTTSSPGYSSSEAPTRACTSPAGVTWVTDRSDAVTTGSTERSLIRSLASCLSGSAPACRALVTGPHRDMIGLKL